MAHPMADARIDAKADWPSVHWPWMPHDQQQAMDAARSRDGQGRARWRIEETTNAQRS
jgi:hypothetical protein